jgi:enterochelin esterase-like enzyme
MEKFLLLVVLTILLLVFKISIVAQGASTITTVEFDSATLNRIYQYKVYLPASYENSDRSYPVVYLLHGRGDTMDAWLNVRDTLDVMIAAETIPPVIAIMPDMPSSDRGSYYVDSQYTGILYRAEAVETAFMNDLIPHVDSTYRTLKTREGRIIGGYSMGGYGALRYSMVYPEKFVGTIVLSPAVYIPLPPVDSSTREFGAFGSGGNLFDEDVYQSLNYPALIDDLQATGLPLYMFIAVGDDEWKNPNPEDQLHDLDVEAHMVFNHLVRVSNVSAEFRVYDGGHDWDVWQRGFSEGMQYLTPYLAQ